MLLEQVEREETGQALASGLHGKLLLVMDAEVTVTFLVDLQTVERLLEEAVQAHINGVNIFD